MVGVIKKKNNYLIQKNNIVNKKSLNGQIYMKYI